MRAETVQQARLRAASSRARSAGPRRSPGDVPSCSTSRCRSPRPSGGSQSSIGRGRCRRPRERARPSCRRAEARASRRSRTGLARGGGDARQARVRPSRSSRRRRLPLMPGGGGGPVKSSEPGTGMNDGPPCANKFDPLCGTSMRTDVGSPLKRAIPRDDRRSCEGCPREHASATTATTSRRRRRDAADGRRDPRPSDGGRRGRARAARARRDGSRRRAAPLAEGRPIAGEVVTLAPRKDNPRVCDVKESYRPPSVGSDRRSRLAQGPGEGRDRAPTATAGTRSSERVLAALGRELEARERFPPARAPAHSGGVQRAAHPRVHNRDAQRDARPVFS